MNIAEETEDAMSRMKAKSTVVLETKKQSGPLFLEHPFLSVIVGLLSHTNGSVSCLTGRGGDARSRLYWPA